MSRNQAVLAIDLDAISLNYNNLLKRLRPGCRLGAAVKANGYGLGAAEVSRQLFSAGCRDFFVSSPEEGVELRSSLENGRIYVLNGFYASRAEFYIEHNLVPMLGSFLEIEGYKKLGAKHGKKLDAYLSFNTRMNRLGLGSVETGKLLQQMDMLDGLNVIGILSHFAASDEKDHPLNETQYELFKNIAQHFPRAEKSLTNSSGIFRDQKYHFDLARSGMALWGLNPTPETSSPMKPVISLKAPILRMRMVYKGASVGYNATYTFDKDTWLATVSAGYADGVFWNLSNKGALYWKGYKCPIRGRVSMDLTTVDLSEVPENERPKPGDALEILGEHQQADDLAKDAGTIGYEILTRLSNRYERKYINSIPANAGIQKKTGS